MIVIVPHRDIELKLINAQKKIIKEIIKTTDDLIPYAVMPLWIKTDFESVEQAKKKITHVTVFAPEYDNEQECLVCPVEIKTLDGIKKSKLDFIRGLTRFAHNDVAIHIDDETFPLLVKIFRLGECISSKPGVYELTSSVWKKIK
jgi:hypothetical protein